MNVYKEIKNKNQKRLDNLSLGFAFNKEQFKNMQNNYLKIDGLKKQMESSILAKQKESEKIFQTNVSKLDALSPLKTLARGYSIIEKQGKMIKSYKDLSSGDKIELKFIDGKREAEII